MSKYCNIHIKYRTDEELLEYWKKQNLLLKDRDPRSMSGKLTLRNKLRAKEELKRRGIDPSGV